MALATDSISIWLRYEVKYIMLLRPKESGQASDSVVYGSLNKLLKKYFVKCRLNTNNIQKNFSSVIFHRSLVKFNVCIMLWILMTPHVHISMVYIVKMQFQMPMYMYILTAIINISNKIGSILTNCMSNECMHTHSNLAKSGIWSIDCEIWDMGYWGVKIWDMGYWG